MFHGSSTAVRRALICFTAEKIVAIDRRRSIGIEIATNEKFYFTTTTPLNLAHTAPIPTQDITVWAGHCSLRADKTRRDYLAAFGSIPASRSINCKSSQAAFLAAGVRSK